MILKIVKILCSEGLVAIGGSRGWLGILNKEGTFEIIHFNSIYLSIYLSNLLIIQKKIEQKRRNNRTRLGRTLCRKHSFLLFCLQQIGRGWFLAISVRGPSRRHLSLECELISPVLSSSSFFFFFSPVVLIIFLFLTFIFLGANHSWIPNQATRRSYLLLKLMVGEVHLQCLLCAFFLMEKCW